MAQFTAAIIDAQLICDDGGSIRLTGTIQIEIPIAFTDEIDIPLDLISEAMLDENVISALKTGTAPHSAGMITMRDEENRDHRVWSSGA